MRDLRGKTYLRSGKCEAVPWPLVNDTDFALGDQKAYRAQNGAGSSAPVHAPTAGSWPRRAIVGAVRQSGLSGLAGC